ncbi:MAG: GAF domain-containing protein [Chloroflexi bacterium]|nr:MAG: GAF domain-containing protein [Chloroflexota bacterium]
MSGLRRFSIFAWPFWLKFLVGFVIAIVVPVVVISYVLLLGIQQVGAESLESFISENGRRHSSAVNTALDQTQAEIEQFIANPDTNRLLTSFLLRNARSNTRLPIDDVDVSDINELFVTGLLNTPLNQLESAQLVDRNGIIVAEATTRSLLATPPNLGNDISNSPTFVQASNTLSAERNQVVTIFAEDDEPAIEVANIILWRDGSALGYLIGRLDVEQAIYDNLTFTATDADLGAYSYVISRNNVLFSPRDTRSRAEQSSVQSPVIQQALRGAANVGNYRTGVGGGLSVIGFYTPLQLRGEEDTPVLVLITEVPDDAIFTRLIDIVEAQLFVLLLGFLVLLVLLVILFTQIVSPPLNRLRTAMQAMARGNFGEPVPSPRKDEIGELTVAFTDMREQVRHLINDLEQRIATRTRDIVATQEISRFAVTQNDLQTLIDRVVDLIVEHFPLIYHAQIFMVDDNRQFAILRASTGETGQKMLASGHRLPVGSLSVIGQVTEQGRVVVARNTSTSEIHRRNEFLPDTASELAIPLRIGSRIIGALDVQSKLGDAFTEDEINVLQTMADQISVAIENARLYQESQRRLEELERSNQAAVSGAWQTYLLSRRTDELSSQFGTTPEDSEISEIRQMAVQQKTTIIGEATERGTIPIAVPIQLRGQVIGAIEWEFSTQDFDNNKVLLAQELANRLAISLDTARLFQESRQTANRERVVNTIAARISAQSDIDHILQTAVREVGQALRIPQVSINFNLTNDSDGGMAGESNGHHNNKGND